MAFGDEEVGGEDAGFGDDVAGVGGEGRGAGVAGVGLIDGEGEHVGDEDADVDDGGVVSAEGGGELCGAGDDVGGAVGLGVSGDGHVLEVDEDEGGGGGVDIYGVHEVLLKKKVHGSIFHSERFFRPCVVLWYTNVQLLGLPSFIARVMEDANMAEPARTPQPTGSNETNSHALRKLPPALPIMMNVQSLANLPEGNAGAGLRYVDGSKGKGNQKGNGVLRGIKDLQQLQRQTIAVLEAVKANLEDIHQVLRSPEATRGLEKQQNAATLLAKGFARDAVEQANGAVGLLPANPEAHLLLALSLAADQQFDGSLAAARKGLALFDRRTHPLAIEAGLLHALAALGCGAEAAERWAVIIEGLPVPVLLEHLGRIAACFPAEAPEGQLDEWVTARLGRGPEVEVRGGRRSRSGVIETRPGEIPASMLFVGLEAAHEAKMGEAHRAILGMVGQRLKETRDATDILRFLTECVVPLGNTDLTRSTNALGRAAVKRLLKLQADAGMLFRAMEKLHMAGARDGTRELARLLEHWRKGGAKLASARRMLMLAVALLVGGVGLLAYVLWPMGALAGKQVMLTIGVGAGGCDLGGAGVHGVGGGGGGVGVAGADVAGGVAGGEGDADGGGVAVFADVGGEACGSGGVAGMMKEFGCRLGSPHHNDRGDERLRRVRRLIRVGCGQFWTWRRAWRRMCERSLRFQ